MLSKIEEKVLSAVKKIYKDRGIYPTNSQIAAYVNGSYDHIREAVKDLGDIGVLSVNDKCKITGINDSKDPLTMPILASHGANQDMFAKKCG